MEIKYPIIVLVVLILIIVILFWKRRKKKKTKIDQKVRLIANASLVKNTKEYKSLARKYYVCVYSMLGALSLCILFVAILSARLVTVKKIDDKKYNRDIILCMDVSGSMDELNYEIIDTYKDIVGKMNGERFGISIFNTSSYLLTPLTDDYEYVGETLANLQHAYETIGDNFSSLGGLGSSGLDDYLWSLSYLTAGTTVGEGSSKTGEGLASCLYDFADLESDRSRIIILSSDNEVFGGQLVDVVGAAELANNKKVKVYVLAPGTTHNENLTELQKAASLAGGKIYIHGNANNTSEVIAEIENTEKTLLEGASKTVEIDHPVALFVLAMVFFLAFIAAVRFI